MSSELSLHSRKKLMEGVHVEERRKNCESLFQDRDRFDGFFGENHANLFVIYSEML